MVFDGTSSKNATVDAAFGGTVSAVQINSGYTGTITLDRSLNLGSFTQNAGTFAAQTHTLTVAANFTVSDGTFDAGTGTLRFSHTGGSSTHTIAINGATGGLLNVNHVTFADGGSGTKTYNLGTGDGFFVRGDLTVEHQSGSTATMKVNGGNFVVVGTTTLGAGYQAGSPAPTFHTVAAGAGIVSGAVFNDLNGDGVKHANELGLAGWTVQLYDDLSQLVATTTTGSTGSYQFLDLAPGTYTVQQVLPSGWTPTLAPPSTITVAAGDNTIAQFGNFQNMTLAGTLFDDRNQDGVQQASEPGLQGRTVEIYTVTAGVLSSAPVATTTSDVNGNYGFTNLGPLPAGTSYVIAQAVPNGWTQTAPNLANSNTMTLPNGQVGYVVAAQSGVPAVTTSGQTTQISGTGTLKINQRNNNTTATVSFNDGAGHSGSSNVYLTQFNVTWNGAGGPATFHTFCVDLFHTVSTGQTYGVGVRGDLASAFANGSRIAYVYQRYGTADLTGNDIQAAAVQIAVWTLSLNNHNPTYFARDADGSYSSGNENVFQVHFGSNPNAAAIAALVDRYLRESLGDPAQGSFFQSDENDPNPGQHMLVPDQQHNVGNRALPLAQDDHYRTLRDQPLTVSGFGVLGNDISPYQEPLTVRLLSQPNNGIVHLNADGVFTYTPGPGFVGVDTFIYRAGDGISESEDATVSVTVYAGRFRFSQDTYVTAEGTGYVTITVERTGLPIGSASVEYRTLHGDALGLEDGSGDYVPASGILDFADSEVAKAFTIAITDDPWIELDEFFLIQLANPSLGYLLDESLQTSGVLIGDNDGGEQQPQPEKPFGGALQHRNIQLEIPMQREVEEDAETGETVIERVRDKLTALRKTLEKLRYNVRGVLTGDIFDRVVFEQFQNLQANENKILITINGINTTENEARNLLNSVRAFDVGNRKVAVVNGTHGLGDARQIVVNELGRATIADLRAATQIEIAAEALRRSRAQNPTIYVVAHSQGTEVFWRALDFLKPETKAMIEFHGNGGQRFVPDNVGLKKAVNYYYTNDLVPYIANYRLLRLFEARRKGYTYEIWNLGPSPVEGRFPRIGRLREMITLRAHSWDDNYARLYSQPGGVKLPNGARQIRYPP